MCRTYGFFTLLAVSLLARVALGQNPAEYVIQDMAPPTLGYGLQPIDYEFSDEDAHDAAIMEEFGGNGRR